MTAQDQTAPLALETPPARAESVGLARGAVVGRYIIVDRVGSGGAGEVYSAFDSTLSRTVALKVLHGDLEEDALGPEDTAGGWRRLVREAQTLARLSHPNVVTVHDVGHEDGLTYIAMELVDGEDLATWIEKHRGDATLATRLDLAVGAGHGLAAAHDANIVHRDFKPANVLVGRDGRARVSDFGIARGEYEGTIDARELGEPAQERVTSVAGTPYYLAPEQHDGAPGDRRSDIYSFCVTLYELALGRGPFDGKTIASLGEEKHAGPPAVASDDVPQWLCDIIERGLEPDPDRRFRSMRELLGAIAKSRTRRRQRGLGLAVVGGGIAIAAGSYFIGDVDAACSDVDRHLEGVWDNDTAQAVDASLRGVDLPLAPRVAEQASEKLDAYALAWTNERREVCVAAGAHEEASTLLDRRIACLDQRRTRLEATVEILSDADQEVLTRAPGLLANLPAIDRCADAAALLAEVPPPEDPEEAKEARDIRGQLQRHNAARDAARFDAAKAFLDDALDRAEALNHEPILAEAKLYAGVFINDMGEHERARGLLEAAHFTAERSKHDVIAARASAKLIQLLAVEAGGVEAALQWAPHAESAAARAGGGRFEVAYLVNYAWVLDAASRFDEAREKLERAIEIGEEILDPDDMQLVDAYTTLGGVMVSLGKPADAIGLHERALEVVRRKFGKGHPNVGKMWGAIGIAQYELRDTAAAKQAFEAELALFVDALGPDHTDVATAHVHLGAALHDSGDMPGALREMERALEILVATKGADNEETLDTAVNVAKMQMMLGEFDKTLELLYDLRPRIERAHGKKHTSYADVQRAIGDAERQNYNAEAAVAPHAEAYAIRLELLGADHPNTIRDRLAVARTDLALHNPKKARKAFEEILVAMDGKPMAPLEYAEVKFALARSLARTDGDKVRARDLAEEALAAYQPAGPAWEPVVADINEFLATEL